MTDAPAPTQRIPVLSIIAGATLVLSLFTPRLLLTLPIMATVGLSIIGAVRKDTPRPLPYIIAAAAVLLVLLNSRSSLYQASSESPPASALYKEATWDYGSAKDAMRGTVSKWATLYSPTDLNFSPPYEGANAAHIQLDNSDSIILQINKGQLICDDAKNVSVKFDKGPIWIYPCEPGANGDTNTIYIEPAYDVSDGQPHSIVDGIAKSKTMTIETRVYDNGYPQITFNVVGLDRSKLK